MSGDDQVTRDTLLRHEQEIGVLKGAIGEIKDNTAAIKDFMAEMVELSKTIVALQGRQNNLEEMHNQNHDGTVNAHRRIDEVVRDMNDFKDECTARFKENDAEHAAVRPLIKLFSIVKDNFIKLLGLGITITILTNLGIDPEKIKGWFGG